MSPDPAAGRLPPLKRDYVHPLLTVGGRAFRWGERTYLMGIINVTPDSFSGDGLGCDTAAAADLARRFQADGADILDVGAESTRPGASPITPAQELDRLLPALDAVRAATSLPISVDTSHAAVAAAALDVGAGMINDITGLLGDPAMATLLAGRGVPVVAMHNQRGRPEIDVIEGLRAGFTEILQAADAAGLPRDRLILDPGFGFGWRPEQNLEMLRRLPELWHLQLPLLLGPSRKSTIGLVLDAPVEDRLEGTAAAVALAIAAGADILRVHDVRQMARAARVADAVVRGHWRPA